MKHTIVTRAPPRSFQPLVWGRRLGGGKRGGGETSRKGKTEILRKIEGVETNPGGEFL